MSTDKIYVNPTNKQLKFLYLPITNYNATLDIQNFFKKLPYEAIFNQHEDCDYVKEYIKYFKDSINFSLYEFEKMLEEMIKKESAVPVVAHTSKMLDGINNKENAKFFNRSNNSENRTNFYEIEEEGTVVLDDESEGTTTLEESVTTLKIYPRLLRKRTGEIIKINKLEFSVGKGKTADFSIDNNTAVSRVHAKIYTRGGRFFIQDNNSTNGTFVDNERLEPGTETEISSGQIIKLADEEFECM